MLKTTLMSSAARRATPILFCALLAACGGGSGSTSLASGGAASTLPSAADNAPAPADPAPPTPSNPAPGNVLGVFGVVAQSERTAAGGEHITFTASKPSPTDTVVWSLEAGSPGSLDRTSGDMAQYIPPAAGNASGSAAVVVTASIGSATKKTTIFLEGALGLRLLAGNDFGSGAVNASGQAARFSTSGGIARDAQGNVYVADSGNGVIRKVTAQGEVTTFAGSASATGSVDGTGAAARFCSPLGITIDAAGNLFVTDASNNNIRKITPSGVVTTVAGDPSLPAGSNDGTGKAAKFNRPSGIAVDLAGNLYVSDTGNQKIRKITPAGVVTTLARNNDLLPVESRLLFGPRGIALDVSGNVYVVDSAINGDHNLPYCYPDCNYFTAAVRKITPQEVVTTFAGKDGVIKIGNVPNSDAVARDGPGTEARFGSGMNGIAIDATGNLYVTTKGPVRKITQEGIVSTLPNNSGGSIGGDWLALDPAGKLYIGGQSIREMSFNGDIATLAGSITTDGYRDGSGRSALFHRPVGIASDQSGNLYVADDINSAVRKITPLGEVSTLLKSPSYTGWKNITIDASGNIYVNSGGDGIRKISPSGNVSVLPNTNSSVITTDAGGNLYGVEYNSNVIRKITPEGIASTITVNFDIGFAKGIAADRAGNLYVLQNGVSKITQDGARSFVAAEPANFYPIGMTIDSEDNLYVAYFSITAETIIQKITPQGTVSNVFSSYTGDGVATDGNHLYMPKGIAMAGAKTIALTVDNGVFLLQLP